jgi:hypothetical protein
MLSQAWQPNNSFDRRSASQLEPSVCAIPVSVRVKLSSPSAQLGSPLYPQEQASPAGPVRSEKCHELTCAALFDHLVGAGEQHRRSVNARCKAACQGHSGSPAKRKPSVYLAKSSGRNGGKTSARLDIRNVGSIWRMRDIALRASSTRPANARLAARVRSAPT